MGSSGTGDLVLRRGAADDADIAAALHAGQIAEGFLSFLGAPFLARLYRRIVLHDGSFLLVVDDGNATIGFLAGTTDVRALYRSFLRHDGPAAAFGSSVRLLCSWRRVLETLRHGGGGSGGGAELLSVAVDPTAQGRGAGRILVDGFLAEVGRLGHQSATVVVAEANTVATALYAGAGFRVVERFELHAGTVSLLMRWSSDTAAA